MCNTLFLYIPLISLLSLPNCDVKMHNFTFFMEDVNKQGQIFLPLSKL